MKKIFKKKKKKVLKQKSKFFLPKPKFVEVRESYRTIEYGIYITSYSPGNENNMVCEAINSLTDEEVILKILPKQKNNLKEICIHYKLHHYENIVSIKDFLETNNSYILVLEQAKGGDLLEHILTNGKFTETQLKRIGLQVCNSIAVCHAHGVAHLDIKPDNIFLTENNDIILGDFGGSEHFPETETIRNVTCPTPNSVLETHELENLNCYDRQFKDISESSYIFGTLEYTANEVFKHKYFNPFYADLWSLGVTLYILLTGLFPYSEKSINAFKKNLNPKKLKIHKNIYNNLSEEAADVIQSLLSTSPYKRPTIYEIIQHPFFNVQHNLSNNNNDDLNRRSLLSNKTSSNEESFEDNFNVNFDRTNSNSDDNSYLVESIIK